MSNLMASSNNASGLLIDGTAEHPDFKLELLLKASPGQTTALLGPNGAGKSTAVSAIAGLLPLTSGSIALAGQILDDPQERIWITPQERHIGIAFQDGLLFSHMSVLDNVAFGLTARGMPRNQAHLQAQLLLEQIGLANKFAERSPATLSGGQAQSVALARALLGEPRLVLLDEPFGSLDASVRTRLRRNFSQLLNRTAAPRLLITHDPADAFLLADVIYIMENGRITQVGSPEEIRRRPQTAYAADLAEINLLAGQAKDGQVQLPTLTLQVADHAMSGPVQVTIHPRSVTLHRTRPSGSPRNVWQTVVTALEPRTDVTRVVLEQPVSLIVDITTAAALELDITLGSEVWVAVKATEIALNPDGAALGFGTDDSNDDSTNNSIDDLAQ